MGIWKDYEDLENSLSMAELFATLSASREKQHEHHKFLAAIEGINIDDQGSGGQKEWEDMKARVYSGNATTDSNDIISLQGINAQQAGFGIGAGLEYTDAKDLENPSW